MLHYKEYGNPSAPLMIFIHGGGVSSWMWDKQIQYFTDYHCLVPDLPGQGKSVIYGKFTIQSCAEMLIELIESKAMGKKVIAIGFSLGAQILIAMLSIKPDLFDCSVINSALVRPFPLEKLWIALIKLLLPLIKNRTFSKIQAESMYLEKEYFETYFQESLLMSKDTLVNIMEENMSFRIPDNFKNARGKILVTVGEQEKRIMKKSLADILKSNSNCKGLIIPHVGHGVSLANPDFFNKLIKYWVHTTLFEQ
ncbi:Pimeloyl-ACP methyl ester carboxylesterase [Paenibacillus sophorae]|nr:Pimeloyl-ACP methyl ester carboxylesterase [Paenibacillus sophorae]